MTDLPTVAEVLSVQLDQAWANGRIVLEGLTDDEYFWEPVDGCWSVRRREDASRAWGLGDFVCEDAWLTDVQRRWADAVRSLTAEEAFEERPAHWGERVPVVNLVSLMNIEHRHHLAEVGVLRDLRAGHARLQPPPAAIDAPFWWNSSGA